LYQVRLPDGSEAVYEYAAPVFLALAAVAAGAWLLRFRTIRSARARLLLWVCGGSLATAFTAHWVWTRSQLRVQPGNSRLFAADGSLSDADVIYEIVVPLVLSLAVAAVWVWLLSSRTIRTAPARLVLWVG